MPDSRRRRPRLRSGALRQGLCAAGLLAGACAVEGAPPRAAPEPLAQAAASRSAADCTRIERIEIRTRQRELRAWCQDGGSLRMQVAVGRRRDGPKRRRGDMRTPHGFYRVAGPARPSRFHLFIPLDYPSRVDAAEALAQGVISEAAWRRILDAHESGALPPQDTDLGGHLGIHGEGARWRGATAHVDWTLGCVALKDREIEILAERIEPGTPVLLLP